MYLFKCFNKLFTLSLQKPTKLNCDSVYPTDPYEYSINSSLYRGTNLTTVTFTMVAGQTFTMSVKVRNSAGKRSQPVNVQETAPETG